MAEPFEIDEQLWEDVYGSGQNVSWIGRLINGVLGLFKKDDNKVNVENKNTKNDNTIIYVMVGFAVIVLAIVLFKG